MISNRASTLTILLFAAVALVAAGAGLWLAGAGNVHETAAHNQAELRDGPFLTLPQAKPIADFALYDDAGKPFSKSDLEGDWTLVFFGFTSCPHICPDTLFQLTRAVNQLGEGVLPEERPKVLLIGVDPGRDTPQALSKYRERFGNEIEAVSGPDAQLRALAMQLGVHYVVPEHDEGAWYNVDHSMNVLLLNPDAEWVGVFSGPHDGAAMAEPLARYLAGVSGR